MKHVLITGGSDGLGKITAQKLHAAGYAVTILSRDESRTKAAAEEMGCKYVVADVADYAQLDHAIEQAVDQNGPVDVLINCAGIWIAGALEANKPEDIERTIATNVLGTIYATRAVVPAMKERKSGRIVNISSQVGLKYPTERSVYAASKWAVTGFTKVMQTELKPHNISVVGFYPGGMTTGMFAKVGDMKDRSKALDPHIAADTLVYLCGLPENVEVPELGIESLDY